MITRRRFFAVLSALVAVPAFVRAKADDSESPNDYDHGFRVFLFNSVSGEEYELDSAAFMRDVRRGTVHHPSERRR